MFPYEIENLKIKSKSSIKYINKKKATKVLNVQKVNCINCNNFKNIYIYASKSNASSINSNNSISVPKNGLLMCRDYLHICCQCFCAAWGQSWTHLYLWRLRNISC